MGSEAVYSVWAIPPEDVGSRCTNLMTALRSEFGGPSFHPHITVVGAIKLTPDDALAKLRSACQALRPFHVTVDGVATGTFFYQCVYLLLRPDPHILETSAYCCTRFGYANSTPYMPHLSLLYGDLTDQQKRKAQERANAIDDSLAGLTFPINRLALYKTDTEDRTLKSWEKIAECTLAPN
ncbi:cyclic phosphodiesterase [Cajanus cajan]|uniref:Cyclic phosphodiesterase n=1 Tax=Cajanus cajan TaxID=3821 RepID=A0A151R6H7_CAJCA|nr:cyclic phosphodiesterase [Cajanus cajan]KYP38096.1 Cyclic phosphodiesterase [Cajanus cajan]